MAGRHGNSNLSLEYMPDLELRTIAHCKLPMQWVIEDFAQRRETKIHSDIFEAGGFYW